MGFSFLPKEEKFYTYLTALAAEANRCARLLGDFVSAADDASRATAGEGIMRCRSASKDVMGKLTDDLGRTFVTPFDREDIQNFAHSLYRIPKTVEKTIQRMTLHGLRGAESDFAQQAAVIAGEAQVMEEMVGDLISRRNGKKVIERVAVLHALEQKGDDVLQELLSALFSAPRDAKDLILRKDIYYLMEKIIDSYRDAAAVMLQIVLKYS